LAFLYKFCHWSLNSSKNWFWPFNWASNRR